jgi:hypothetical protein
MQEICKNGFLFQILYKNLLKQNLESSAKLYLDEYENDTELQDLTESALIDYNE